MTDDTVNMEKNDGGKAQRVEVLTRALLYALVSAVPEQPYPIPVPVAVAVAGLLDDCGVRQTDERAAEIELPGWITERVREQSQEAPTTTPDVHAPQPSALVRKAPPLPDTIPKKLLGVVTSQ